MTTNLSTNRKTIPFSQHSDTRLSELTKKFNISQARLLSCLLEMSDDAIEQAIRDNHDKLFLKATLADKRRREKALSTLKQLSPEEIQELLKEAGKVVNDGNA